MAYVKTEPVRARFVTYEEFFDGDMCAEPGTLTEEPGTDRWLYGCPCGCGASGALRVGDGVKPSKKPSWRWNGDRAAPVLRPSVHHLGHWHGWLGGSRGERPGWWVSC